ncbi:hypothetical protein B590_30488 (plasmid) [Streptomyces sp. PVA_94-07]|uniref:hypothetical protein n=1 Tax=Streptomyces sp. PVA_94-07 TaxID=1225337 RepID=UPI0003C2C556|nr:hypothetical protein [Streptomyces sp. PVA_94-07]ESQ01801.1 hypothetical protein B590_30488 [Streptomyces sp. PVA_94-07]
MPSRAGDEAVRDLLDENRGYRAAEVDAWLARSLANQSGHYADPAARTAAVGLLPVSVRAALLAALAAPAPRSTATSSLSGASPRPTRPPRTHSPRGSTTRPR